MSKVLYHLLAELLRAAARLEQAYHRFHVHALLETIHHGFGEFQHAVHAPHLCA